MIKCPNCMNLVSDDSQFCSHCGEKFQFCDYCGSANLNRAKFCQNCGAQLEKRIDESTYTQSSQSGYQHDESIYHERESHDHTYPKYDESKYDHSYTGYDTYSSNDGQKPFKIYWRIVIVAVLALALVTGASYLYLKLSSPLDYVDDSGNNTSQDYSDGSVNTGAVETYNKATFDATATSQNEKFSNLCMTGKFDCDGSTVFMTDDSGRLVRLSTNFSDGSAIVNEKVSYINVADGRVYYCDSQNYVHSCNYDGSDNQTLISTATYYLTYYDGKLYYQNDPDNESLYVYDLSSGQSTKLVDRHMYNMSINDGVIYYCSRDGVFAYNIATKEDKQLVEGSNHSVFYYDGFVYYTASGGYLNRYSLADGTVEAIYNDGSVASIAFSDKALYVYRVSYSSGAIVRIDMETKNTTTVYEGILSSYTDYQVVGDNLIINVDGHYQTLNTSDGRMERIFK